MKIDNHVLLTNKGKVVFPLATHPLLWEGFDLIAHRDLNLPEWVVTEVKSGKLIAARNKTRKEATEKAVKLLDTLGIDKVEQLLGVSATQQRLL